MLERIREGSKGPVAKIILFLIIITFALTGVSGYLGGSSEEYVAKVNGEEISRVDFDRAYQNERSRMEEQLGEFFETLTADEDYMREFRRGVLDRLIDERLATQFAKKQGFRPSAESIRQNIRQMPEFQVGGEFSNDRYVSLLMNAGFTPEQFRDYMAGELGRSSMVQGAIASEFTLPHEAQQYQRLQNQRRSGEYLRIAVADYVDQVTVSDAEIEDFYFDNESRFETDERLRVEYILLDFEAVLANIEVSEDEARRYFDDNPEMFRSAERREIAHILIEGDEQEAQARIEEIQARLADGEDFATLAEAYSDDTFSGPDGGELGRLQRGMIDPDIEDAGFALEQEGDVSDVVRSEFGFHLVKLTRFQPAQLDDFDDAREEIVENLRREQAEQVYYDIQQELARISFEIPESLEPAAEATGLEIRESDWLTREGNSEINHPRVLQEAFSEDVLEHDMNSELVEVDERSYVVRAAEYEPAQVRPLDDVRGDIEQALRMQKAQQEARLFAEQLQQQYLAGELPDNLQVERFDAVTRYDDSVPSGVLNQLFRLSAPGSQGAAGVTELQDGDLALVAVTSIEQGEVDDTALAEYAEQFEPQYMDRAYRAMIQALRADADIDVRL